MQFGNLLRRLWPGATILAAALGCGGSEGGSGSVQHWQLDPPTWAAAEIARATKGQNQGAALYQHYCAPCHGPAGKGDGQYFSDTLAAKPPDLNQMVAAGQLSDEHLAKVIQQGSAAVGKSPLCPPWGRVISDEQLAALVAHIPHLGVKAEELEAQAADESEELEVEAIELVEEEMLIIQEQQPEHPKKKDP